MTDWNQYKGDRQNSARRPDLEGPKRLEESWSVELAAQVTCSPVCWGETVLVGTERTLVALDTRGARRWTLETDAPVAGTPIATRDNVFVAVTDGTVFALESTTGDVAWQYAATGPLESSLAVSDGRLFVGDAGGLAALEAETGERLWYYESGSETASDADTETDIGPDIDTGADSDVGGKIGAETDTEIELETGADSGSDTDTDARAASESATAVVGCPAIVDRRAGTGASTGTPNAGTGEELTRDGGRDRDWDHDRVIVATADGTVVALEAGEGTEVWRAPTSGSIVDGPTVDGDRVYTADDAGTLLALSADTGQSWFAYKSNTTFTTGPTVLSNADAAFVGGENEYLHVVETTFGKRKLRGLLFSKDGVSLDGTVTTGPVVIGDVLCVGDSSGTLYGIAVDDEQFGEFLWHHPTDRTPTRTPASAQGKLYVVFDDDRLTCLEWDGA